jgi:hypothetical protein
MKESEQTLYFDIDHLIAGGLEFEEYQKFCNMTYEAQFSWMKNNDPIFAEFQKHFKKEEYPGQLATYRRFRGAVK